MDQELHNKATAAAVAAANAQYAKIGDCYPCGFAWVTVYGVKLSSRAGKEFAKAGFNKGYHGGIELWNPSKSPVQNVGIKAAGAEAYAAVLRAAGYDAHSFDRLD